MKIKRWDGQKLIEVANPDLPNFAREGLYVERAGGVHHLWVYGGPDPVPDSTEIKAKIQKEVPH